MMGHVVRLSGNEISAALKAGSREPFREILEIFLDAAPTAEEVAVAARRGPDRYVQALTMLAKLGGYPLPSTINRGPGGDFSLKIREAGNSPRERRRTISRPVCLRSW